MPTKTEWTDFQKHTRRMRELQVDVDLDPVSTELLLVMQFRSANEPFLPRLKSFKCKNITEAFIPFIPLFLSPQTIEIDVLFATSLPVLAIAPTIGIFPTICPNLERMIITELAMSPVITDAVSEMLLACNRDSLQVFEVGSSLTEEAREVIYRLPKLSRLWALIEGHMMLPQVALPNLIEIDIRFDGHLDWLQGFRGTTLGKLERVFIYSESNQIGDFLGAFESVMLTTSAQNTLSEFGFYASCAWNPDYYSLLSFKQLKDLDVEFCCYGGCSSKVDDDVMTALAQAMPKLEVLRLGQAPCETPTGVTVHGLIILASCCTHLSRLCVHFRGDSLVDAAASATTTFPPTGEPVFPREGCALTDLEVGSIPIPAHSATRVAQMLLQIFPRITNVEYINPGWRKIAEYITDFRRIGTSVPRTGKAHPVASNSPLTQNTY
jgi:hypothetical protein